MDRASENLALASALATKDLRALFVFLSTALLFKLTHLIISNTFFISFPVLSPECVGVDCSGQGECEPSTGECICDEGFTGSDCELGKYSKKIFKYFFLGRKLRSLRK